MLKPNIEDAKKTLTKTAFPQDVIVEVTAHCNLRCIMCPQKNLKRQQGVMDFAVFKKIVDEIAVENPETRLWPAIMGEPLLLGDKIVEMVKYAKDKGIKSIHLNSNAVFLTPEISRKLMEAGLDEIIVGLDATTEATYDQIRVGGDFARVVQNLEYLLKLKDEMGVSKPNVVMQFIVMDENESEMEAFKEFWLERGAVVKIRPKIGWGTGVEAKNLNLPDTERNFPCSWLVRTVSIHWTGKFAQCDADFEGEYSPGDVRTQTIKEIWNSELASRREKHWAGDFTHPLCSKCKDWQAGRSLFFNPKKKGVDGHAE